MQWTFDNHQIFLMARALLDLEEARIVKFNDKERREAAQANGDPIGVIMQVIGSGTLNLEGAPGITLMMEEYLQSLWQTGAPPTLNNDYDFYNVAVRRCHDPENVWVFPAAYANNYDGELQDQDGIAFIANGWFDVGQDADGGDSFSPTLENGDEVLGWQPMPKFRP
jgi:hypothetical protein